MTDSARDLRLHALVTAFLAENAKLNLSAFRTEEQCWTGNVLDSMAAVGLLSSIPRQVSHPHPPLRSAPGTPPPQGEGLEEEWMRGWKKSAVNRTVLTHAREMRNEPTPAESKLWEYLRDGKMGALFRRQHPILDQFILDFYCHEARLGIELDGPMHQTKEQHDRDRDRQTLLQVKGIHILRFTNNQVLTSLPSVLRTIQQYRTKHSPPHMGEGRGVRVKQEQEQNGLEPEVGVGIQEMNILDLGTGGGFPMLPLALALPDVRITGLDSVRKKVDATNRIIAAMEIPNAQCLCGRAETFGRMPEYREHYDMVLVRAVAEINVLLEYASPFVKPGGRIVLWKSMDVEQELKESERAQEELHCRLIDRHVYELPGDWGRRQLLVFEKTAPTPEKYPRAVGVPKKKPL